MGRSVASIVRRHWWHEHDRTLGYLRLDATPMIEELESMTDGRRSLGRRAFPEGPPPGDRAFDPTERYGPRNAIGFVLGPLVFLAIVLATPPADLEPAAQAVAATTAWVAIWWITEAIPIPATALLPIVLFPATDALTVAETTPSYAHPIIFLFLGGFFLAMAMQRWGLHRRIALRTIALVGSRADRLIVGFMLATAFLSMWVSNTATVMMMVPIGLAVIAHLSTTASADGPLDPEADPFATALMLCIAYAASVGGVATLIGSPPNLLFAGQVAELFDESITFLQWMYYGVPIAAIGLAVVFVYVTVVAVRPDYDELRLSEAVIAEELDALGAASLQERLVFAVFLGMAGGWVGASLLDQLGVFTAPANVDAIVAIVGALVLFAIPTRTGGDERTFLLDWSTAVHIPWGIVLLFGGGLAIASGFSESGLAAWIGAQLMAVDAVPLVVVLLLIVALTVFLTEVTSNTATAAMLLPILAALAIGIGVHPFGLMIAAATAASFAFMLPVATPPNAIVFGSGQLTIPTMARVGFGLNLLGILLITLIALYWLPIAWNIDVGSLPVGPLFE